MLRCPTHPTVAPTPSHVCPACVCTEELEDGVAVTPRTTRPIVTYRTRAHGQTSEVPSC